MSRLSVFFEEQKRDLLIKQQGVHHDTYMHAGIPPQCWPRDHKAEDTFEVPVTPPVQLGDSEYKALSDGSLVLVTSNSKHIANFGTYADAQLAAKALNHHKGY